MRAFIDGDIVAYSCAIYNEEYGWDACMGDIDALMRRILETTGADEQQTYITGSGNFRYNIYSEYKANRRGKPTPRYRHEAEAYLVGEWGARVTEGCEADDALGSGITAEQDRSVCCSIDKDLMMIPGTHYNWRRNEFYEVDDVSGLRHFYKQLLIGDTVDNIVGVRGIGVKKAGKFLDDVVTEKDMFDIVRTLYKDDERLLMNGRLLWIWRKENDIWESPYFTQEPEA